MTWLTKRSRSLSVFFLCAATVAACSVDEHTRIADKDGNAVLGEKREAAVGDRWEKVVQPAEAATPEAAVVAQSDTAEVSAARVLALREALAIAIDSNREFIAEKEGLFLQALSLFGVRHRYSPLLTALLAYNFAGGEGIPESDGGGLNVGLSQLLETGGNLSMSGLLGWDRTEGEGGDFTSGLGIALSQPLLRGAGKAIAWEALTQAERSMVYAIRDFERFRESFSIDVARRYYSLVEQKKSLENQRRNLEGVEFGRRQAEALFAVGRKSEIDVLRQRRSELQAINALNESEVQLEFALDEFRIFLGLPESERVDVQPEEPRFVEVTYDVESAVGAALENRLDFLTAKDRLEDTYRGLKIAEDGLLPSLDLDAAYNLAGDGSPRFFGQGVGEGPGTYSASIALELPIDRVAERAALRNAQIARAQSLRSFAETRDRLTASVRASFRALDRRVKSLDIQRQLILDQEKTVRKAQIEFERGDATNRDLVEAQQALLEAQNALINEQVQYEIARLQLLRDLGVLFIDEQGMWKE